MGTVAVQTWTFRGRIHGSTLEENVLELAKDARARKTFWKIAEAVRAARGYMGPCCRGIKVSVTKSCGREACPLNTHTELDEMEDQWMDVPPSAIRRDAVVSS